MNVGPSKRPLKVRIKSGKGRSLSSKLWLERQLNDPYVARAKGEGFRGRAAFKLIEIDDKHHLLKPGARVVDLGAAPGGWSQVAARRVGSAQGRGKVVAVDCLEMAPIAGVGFIRRDFLDASAGDEIKALLGGAADVVLSVVAAIATGRGGAERELRPGVGRQPRKDEESTAGDHGDGEIGRLKIGGRDGVASARPQGQIHRKRTNGDADRNRDLLGDRDERGSSAHAAVVD